MSDITAALGRDNNNAVAKTELNFDIYNVEDTSNTGLVNAAPCC